MLRKAFVGLAAAVLVGTAFIPDDALAYRGAAYRGAAWRGGYPYRGAAVGAAAVGAAAVGAAAYGYRYGNGCYRDALGNWVCQQYWRRSRHAGLIAGTERKGPPDRPGGPYTRRHSVIGAGSLAFFRASCYPLIFLGGDIPLPRTACTLPRSFPIPQ